MVDADAKKLAGATPITGFGRLLRKHRKSKAVWIPGSEWYADAYSLIGPTGESAGVAFRGTDGSNPAPSRGESAANSAHSLQRRRLAWGTRRSKAGNIGASLPVLAQEIVGQTVNQTGANLRPISPGSLLGANLQTTGTPVLQAVL
jgi:hypothetical protein